MERIEAPDAPWAMDADVQAGLVDALGTPEFGPAVLHAYDGVSGKALWNSGTSMTTFASPGSHWSALSQVYVGTNDGTVYAFGFADERR